MEKLIRSWRRSETFRVCSFNGVFKRYCTTSHVKFFDRCTAVYPNQPKLYPPWTLASGHRFFASLTQYPVQDWMKVPIGACSLPGRRQKNEDRYCVAALPFGANLCAVFDGHRGSFAAKFLKEEFPVLVEHGLSSCQTKRKGDHFTCGDEMDRSKVREVFESAFASCQENLKREILARFSEGLLIGTTAVAALLSNDGWLTLGQVGDSKAVLCRGGEAITLTVDHTPYNDDETERIISMKGWIDWDSKLFPLVNGQLQMTRSIGDIGLKEYGVTANPTIKQLEIDVDKDAFVVLCSDGITHTVSDEEIIHIVAQHSCPNKAAETLACSAQQYGSTDDVTCLIIPLVKWAKVTPVNKTYSHFRMALGIRGDG